MTILNYFNAIIDNPHAKAVDPVQVSASYTPPLGVTNINYSGITMTLITNIGDEDGGNVYTSKESIVKE